MRKTSLCDHWGVEDQNTVFLVICNQIISRLCNMMSAAKHTYPGTQTVYYIIGVRVVSGEWLKTIQGCSYY